MWIDHPEDRILTVEKEDKLKAKCLENWMYELTDKDNWTIIAATTEYIILQKQGLDEIVEKSNKFFGVDYAKDKDDPHADEDEFSPEKEAEKKVSEKKKDVCARCGQPTVGGWAPKEK